MVTPIALARTHAVNVCRKPRGSRIAAAILTAAMGLWGGTLQGCTTPPREFDTPEAAVDSLVAALRAQDTDELRKIAGSEGQDLLQSGDIVADANDRAVLVRLYDEKHTLINEDGVATLELGTTDWPMPIPLVEGEHGWYFDAQAGADEVLSRRIGRNELAAIQVCLAIHDAQREYAAGDVDGDGWREYATKFSSDPGTKDGLFWPTLEGEPPSPLGEFAAAAAAEGYTATKGQQGLRPYHGYYYRILTAQGAAAPGGAIDFVTHGHMIGGFGVIAWPAEYGSSGLKSFMVSHHGVVYEKDLGDDTDRIARAMTDFDPDAGWEAIATASTTP